MPVYYLDKGANTYYITRDAQIASIIDALLSDILEKLGDEPTDAEYVDTLEDDADLDFLFDEYSIENMLEIREGDAYYYDEPRRNVVHIVDYRILETINLDDPEQLATILKFGRPNIYDRYFNSVIMTDVKKPILHNAIAIRLGLENSRFSWHTHESSIIAEIPVYLRENFAVPLHFTPL